MTKTINTNAYYEHNGMMFPKGETYYELIIPIQARSITDMRTLQQQLETIDTSIYDKSVHFISINVVDINHLSAIVAYDNEKTSAQLSAIKHGIQCEVKSATNDDIMFDFNEPKYKQAQFKQLSVAEFFKTF